MKLRWITLALAIVSATAVHAGQRFVFEPTLQVNEVDDNNLNSSIDDPIADRVQRITPGLALRLDSERWRILGSYSMDHERYQRYSRFDSNRARQRAEIGLEYRVAPRLTLFMNSAYLDTNTVADLNVDTALAGSRVDGRRLAFAPSARYRLSSRVTANVTASTSSTNVVNGIGARIDSQSLGIERRSTFRDRFTLDYGHSHVAFIGTTPQTIETHTLLGGWSHDFGPHDRLMLQAGPRFTNQTASLDLSAEVTRSYRFTSVGLSFVRTQMTVVGYAGTVDTQSLQARFTISPTRRLSAFIAPALVRNSQHQLKATVARTAIGARCTIAPLLDIEVAYNNLRQTGTIDPLRPDANLSHSTLSVGFVTRAR